MKKSVLYFIVFGCSLVGGFLFYNETYSSSGILENVTQQNGYTLNLIDNCILQ